MRKFFGRLISCMICFAIGAGAVILGPELYSNLFGGANTRWISEKLSESLKEKNQLIVYEIETTGIETVVQDAWLIGTVQKVEMPYAFSMNFTVDLSDALVSSEDELVTVRLPVPAAGYPKLVVDEERMTKVDWLYPLTAERYAAIKLEVENRLFEEYSQNEQHFTNAWNAAVKNLQELFQSVVRQSAMGATCDIRILPLEKLHLKE